MSCIADAYAKQMQNAECRMQNADAECIADASCIANQISEKHSAGYLKRLARQRRWAGFNRYAHSAGPLSRWSYDLMALSSRYQNWFPNGFNMVPKWCPNSLEWDMEPSWGPLEAILEHLGDFLGSSWGQLGPSRGHLGSILGRAE